MNQLIQLHAKTGVEQTGYLSQEDRQVGLELLDPTCCLEELYRQFADDRRQHLDSAATNMVNPLDD